MRFLCDEMLVRLARLLRAAGYDTYLAGDGESDHDLMNVAREEGRMVLTKDKRLAAAASPDSVLVAGHNVEAQAKSLSQAVPVVWDYAPFTRCVMDNARLRDATPEQVERMPPQARNGAGPFLACPACGRLYWPGSHVKRMGARLADLAQLPPRAG